MAARLGQVLAWTANVIAVAVLLFGATFVYYIAAYDHASVETQVAFSAGFLIVITAIWAVGRALRYVLAGPHQAAVDGR